MADDELIEFAAGFREGILRGGSSRMMCAAVCWPLAALLRCHGIECDTPETDLGECNHIWIRLADGRALDPTADQFNIVSPGRYPPVYLGPPMELHGGPPAHLTRWHAQTATRAAAYDAEHGAGAWDRAMTEIKGGETLVAIGPSAQDVSNRGSDGRY